MIPSKTGVQSRRISLIACPRSGNCKKRNKKRDIHTTYITYTPYKHPPRYIYSTTRANYCRRPHICTIDRLSRSRSGAAMEPTSKGPKACTTCAKAKARCIAGPDKDSKCERYGSGMSFLLVMVCSVPWACVAPGRNPGRLRGGSGFDIAAPRLGAPVTFGLSIMSFMSFTSSPLPASCP